MKKMKKIFVLWFFMMPLLLNAQDSLMVMSFNIRHCEGEDGKNSWKYRREVLLEYLQASGAAIIGMQEALHPQIEFFSERLNGYAYAGCGRDDGDRKGEYSPVFYKSDLFTCLRSGTFWLSETPQLAGSRSWGAACTRICTWAELESKRNGKKLLVMNTHWDHISSLARINSAGLIKAFADSLCKSLPVIITGDFNAPATDSSVIKLLQNSPCGIKLLIPQVQKNHTSTYHGWGKEKKSSSSIDHIIISQSLQEVFCIIDRVKIRKRFLSDHYPVRALITY